MVGQVDGVQDVGQPVALRRVELKHHRRLHPLVGLERQLQVFKHSELLEHRGFLELAANTQLGNLGFLVAQQVDGGAEENGATVGPGFAGDDVHHRGLARAIGADDAAQFTRCNVERKVVDGLEAVKTHVHIFEVEDTAMGHIHFACVGHAAIPSAATTRLGAAAHHRGDRVFCHTFDTTLHQVGRHARSPFLPRYLRYRPTTPSGRNSVTPINNAPRKYNQYSG